MVSVPQNLQQKGSPDSTAVTFRWSDIVWFGVLLAVCYAPVLQSLVRQWSNDEDMSHGFFVPVIAAFIAWQKRGELLSSPASANRWGLAVVAIGALQLFLATLGAELFVARTAFLVTLIGIILYMGGTRSVQLLAFPFFLMFFMVPIPAIIYNQITFPLQLLASRMAEAILMFIGTPVFREGNILELASQRLSVAEACSGIRSLLSLSFLSLVYAYFFDKKVWMRPLLLVATVPIAIAANASRVTVTGLLSTYNPRLAEGFFHGASGWVIFMAALVILIAFHQLVEKI